MLAILRIQRVVPPLKRRVHRQSFAPQLRSLSSSPTTKGNADAHAKKATAGLANSEIPSKDRVAGSKGASLKQQSSSSSKTDKESASKSSSATAVPPLHPVSLQSTISSAANRTIAFVSDPGAIMKSAGEAGVFCVKSTAWVLQNPRESYDMLREMVMHYYVGSKLLWTEMKIASSICWRVLHGSELTRRERNQLLRTSMDIFRLVPFSFFVLVPFMELALPFALKMFPNMLPSTFQDDLKKEEAMKRELKMRLAWASFLQETVHEMASYKAKADQGGEESGATELLDFIDKARHGEPIDNDIVIRIARLFKDEFTLSNIARPQLVTMCQYMGLQPYGADAFLRFQLKTKLRAIKDDDKRILWEGLHALSLTELREACRERGMRAHGLREDTYRKQLQEWLDLSIQKHVPISLLIMSRAFALGRATTADVLSSSISSLDEDTINEVVLAAASKEEVDTVEMRQRKLDSLEFQKELIDDEREEAEDAKEELRAAKQAHDEAEVHAEDTERKSMKDKSAVAGTRKAADKETARTETMFVEKVKDLREKIDNEGAEQLTVAELETLMDLARDSSVEREKAALAKLEAKIDAMRSRINTENDSHEKDRDSVRLVDVANALEEIEETVTAKESVREPKKKPVTTTGNEDVASAETTAMNVVDPAHDAQLTPTFESSPKREARKDAVTTTNKNIEKMQDMLGGMLSKLKTQIEDTEKKLGDKFRVLDLDRDGEVSAEELQQAIVKILNKKITAEEAKEIVELLDKDHDGKVSVMELMDYAKERKKKQEVEALEAMIAKKDTSS